MAIGVATATGPVRGPAAADPAAVATVAGAGNGAKTVAGRRGLNTVGTEGPTGDGADKAKVGPTVGPLGQARPGASRPAKAMAVESPTVGTPVEAQTGPVTSICAAPERGRRSEGDAAAVTKVTRPGRTDVKGVTGRLTEAWAGKAGHVSSKVGPVGATPSATAKDSPPSAVGFEAGQTTRRKGERGAFCASSKGTESSSKGMAGRGGGRRAMAGRANCCGLSAGAFEHFWSGVGIGCGAARREH